MASNWVKMSRQSTWNQIKPGFHLNVGPHENNPQKAEAQTILQIVIVGLVFQLTVL